MIALLVDVEGQRSEDIYDSDDCHRGRRNRRNHIEISLPIRVFRISHDDNIIEYDKRKDSLHEHEYRHNACCGYTIHVLIMIDHDTSDDVGNDIDDRCKQQNMIRPRLRTADVAY